MTADFLGLYHHVAAVRLVGNGNNGGVTAFFVQFGHDGHFVGSIYLIGLFRMRQGFVLFDFIDGRLGISVDGLGGLAHHLVHCLAEVELGFGGPVKAAF